jgi:hypothetical protein
MVSRSSKNLLPMIRVATTDPAMRTNSLLG